MRTDKRANDEMRLIKITDDFVKYPEGSVLIEFGETKVICNATVNESVPPFLKGTDTGWVTAEYSMLPRSTHSRNVREAQRGKLSGRTHEISRLIGRSLRSAVNLEMLGERSIILDCDVIQADGGTRTASISGAFIALNKAVKKMIERGDIEQSPVTEGVAAVSLGLVNDELLLDLNYEEDSSAQVDMNLVGTESGKIIEIQGTAEESPFERGKVSEMLELGFKGLEVIFAAQKKISDF
ncbi:Ribonuclease PH [Flexistipes sinusarabici DSM 4947]|uniref:Ribonuclease PH n=1 Tax=Flexistipes sinusarabici (strain ATCC 49648 / DSM 4947 / MAS 10) TaxID=717231 RepID=F8E3W7_FLESM|nr:ribonuclease PH [Flexistipes sinusarabici]AEI15469.1 Ribonuclease PH [Flexistipes sinusarabici DSM 4947]